MNEAAPWAADPRLAELETVVRAWGKPFGYRVRWSHGAIPLWGINDERPYLSVDLVESDGRDDVVVVIPLDGGDLVVGMVNGASGICRGWECGPDQLLDVLKEADEYSRSCQSFADAGLH
ncbi:hypothetical protein [Actinomadura sp. 6N118]|uniref:hypothetical protein n=1 Tax=Actinomadura sp. 6N118 TaxID=3375151 RepID=UPI00379DEF25